MSATTANEFPKAGIPLYQSNNHAIWAELFYAHLMRAKKAHLVLDTERPPDLKNEELHETKQLRYGALRSTNATKLLLKARRKKQLRWDSRNEIAFSFLVDSLQKNQIALRVVIDYKTECREAGKTPLAKEAVERLRKRFLSSAGEKAESFINRLLESRARLIDMGEHIDDQVHLAEGRRQGHRA